MPVAEPTCLLDLLILPTPDFIEAAYHLMLDRRPDASELNAQSGTVREGLGRPRFLGDLACSAEFRQLRKDFLRNQSDAAFLEALYGRYLGRQIDPQGMDRYLRALAKGKRRERILREISASREARAKHTLWFDLDRLLADEQAGRYWLLRWRGATRRRERQRNRTIEASLYQAQKDARDPAAASGRVSAFPDPRADAFAGLGPHARQILARARQLAHGRA